MDKVSLLIPLLVPEDFRNISCSLLQVLGHPRFLFPWGFYVSALPCYSGV